MSLLIHATPIGLWHEVVKDAENKCEVQLHAELEAYLVTLLARYINQPKLVKEIFATAFLKAIKQQERERQLALQQIGDGCLLFTGLFPKIVERRRVKIRYFVDLGRTAYSGISQTTDDLYHLLSLQFVVLMDVLQSIPYDGCLLPLDAYEQWNELGSQRALKILKTYTHAFPMRKY